MTNPFSKIRDFERMFKQPFGFEVPPYLMLLHLRAEDKPAFDLLRKKVLSKPKDFNDQIVELLIDIDWRPHLVGAVSMALGHYSPRTITALWQAIDCGSWVSPQLIAVASITDSNFETNARTRIEARCPIDAHRLESTDWVLRHSAAGPGSMDDHSAKALAALIALCKKREEFGTWLGPLLQADDIQEIFKQDRDKSDEIANSWLENLDRLSGI